ncbi:MAG: 2-oxoacid:acceptor oxidoreductase subunit alpha [Verrucomicrobia bacterium]|nr:2-oxoacid:acceptor oxidoreductase subunit alpha [Verrucomicrobiota bacterium]
MSETMTTAPAGGPKVTNISDAVIRIAGNSQDGIQALGGFLARLAGRTEQEVMTYMTIPSTISGGPSIFQVRISSGEALSAGDESDVLLAFYQHSYDEHLSSLKKGGIVLYDSDHVQPKPEVKDQYRHVGVAISNLTVEAIGGTAKDKGKNIFALGLIARMFDLNTDKLQKLISERFASKDASVLNNALTAFQAGYAYPLDNLVERFHLLTSERGVQQVVMTGNEATAYGMVAAGVRFGAAYPITPSSEIMEILRHELPKYGGTFVQCEDEIASVSMVLGAGFAGKVSVTSTSGPGLSLKTEALGWGVIAEVPVVVVDVQRGGPSTGLPTQVEQSDLNIACFGGHGDAPRIVIAASDVEDAFYSSIEAVNLARRYSVPVILLTDQAIGTRIEAFPMPNLEKVCQDISPDLTPVQSHKPYDLSVPDGLKTHRVAGTRIMDGQYPVITGLEHNEMGHPTSAANLHTAMTAKRRAKLQALARSLPVPEVCGSAEGDALLVSWGSTKGQVREAVDRLRAEGHKVSGMHFRHIFPLPEGLDKVFAKFKKIFVVEMNDSGLWGYGQFAALLRSRLCDARIKGINKTEGLTFKVKEIGDLYKAASKG